MTSRRFTLTALWLVLALATLVLLIIEGNPTLWAVAALAWVGGIISGLLYRESGVRRARA